MKRFREILNEMNPSYFDIGHSTQRKHMFPYLSDDLEEYLYVWVDRPIEINGEVIPRLQVVKIETGKETHQNQFEELFTADDDDFESANVVVAGGGLPRLVHGRVDNKRRMSGYRTKPIKNSECEGILPKAFIHQIEQRFKGIKIFDDSISESVVINETFDQTYPLGKFNRGGYEMYEQSATIPMASGDDVTLSILYTDFEGEMTVAFTLDEMYSLAEFKSVHKKSDEFMAELQSKQFRIFQTVLNSMRICQSFFPNHALSFSGEKVATGKSSKADIYRRLIHRFATKLGYKVDSIIHDSEQTFFTLIPKHVPTDQQ